jgi:tellurite resistance protein TerC
VFAHFAIPRPYQHRVLFWGILGAVVMRAVMIFAGTALVTAFHPVLYLFGAFLLVTGARTLFFKEEEKKTIEESKLLVWVKKIIPVSNTLHGNRFFIERADNKRASGKRKVATPLFLALIFIELADVVFAIDSVPAVLAITTDRFVVYTSNIFAILGLRALYFALSAILHRFEYMKYSLSLVLIFIGGKIFLQHWVEISSGVSLGVTLALLLGGILLSLYKTRK